VLDFTLASELLGLISLISELTPKQTDEALRERAARRVARQALRTELLRYGEAQRRWYFGKLELHPVKLNLTFRQPQPHGEAFTEAFTLPIPSVDGAPLCLSALIREHLYGLPDDLIVAIGKHYLFALLRQVMTSS
jgi:hypothetical protein